MIKGKAVIVQALHPWNKTEELNHQGHEVSRRKLTELFRMPRYVSYQGIYGLFQRRTASACCTQIVNG